MTPSASAHALAEHLNDIAGVIEQTTTDAYRARRADGVSGSIGAHVRHVLDHVAALVEPAVDGLVDYDTRRRQTLVEQHRPTAMSELRRLAFRLERVTVDQEEASLRLSAVVAEDGTRVETNTLFGRELVFVLSHTIHHQAIIALLLATAGQRTPERFALAPSTPSFESCAQSA